MIAKLIGMPKEHPFVFPRACRSQVLRFEGEPVVSDMEQKLAKGGSGQRILGVSHRLSLWLPCKTNQKGVPPV